MGAGEHDYLTSDDFVEHRKRKTPQENAADRGENGLEQEWISSQLFSGGAEFLQELAAKPSTFALGLIPRRSIRHIGFGLWEQDDPIHTSNHPSARSIRARASSSGTTFRGFAW